jgi:hypothetical protein
MIESKVGVGSFLERSVISRRTEIRTWSRDDVRANLEGSLRNVTVLARDVEGRGKVSRVPLTEALYRHKVDGNALLELKEDDLLQWIGVCEIGVAKTLLRTVDSLISTRTTIRRPTSAPVNRTVRYSSLDPFDGWDTNDVALHPKRNRLFRVAVPIQKNQTEVTTTSTNTQSDDRPPKPVTHSLGVVTEGTLSIEAVRQPKTEFSLGPLEGERRLAECRAMFDVLRLTQSITLGWLVDCAIAHLELDPSQGIGVTQTCYVAVVASRTRAASRPKSSNNFDRHATILPQQVSLIAMRSVALTRADFIAAVAVLFDEREPKKFDDFFRFLSKQFGAEYIETCRRVDSLRQLFESLSPMSTEMMCEILAFVGSTSQVPPEVTLRYFSEAFIRVTERLGAEEFDQSLMKVKFAASKKMDLAKPGRKRLLDNYDLLQIVEQSTPQKMVLFLSSKVTSTSLLENFFISLRDDQSRLITSRQKNLVVLAVGGDESINTTVSFISTGGFEKGLWILAVCSPSPGSVLLNTFLRRLACSISCRTSASISHQFRVFVHCPIDTVDIFSIPQIAQSSSVIIAL